MSRDHLRNLLRGSQLHVELAVKFFLKVDGAIHCNYLVSLTIIKVLSVYPAFEPVVGTPATYHWDRHVLPRLLNPNPILG